MKIKSKRKKRYMIYGIFVFLCLILNLVAWNSTTFCDWYIKFIFPIWVNTYGRLMNLFSFSVGEIMLFLAVGLAVVFIFFVPMAVGYQLFDFRHRRKVREAACAAEGVCAGLPGGATEIVSEKTPGMFRRFCKYYMIFFAWLVLIVCVIMTLNCTILYHASTFSEKYFGEARDQYTFEELVKVRNLVVEKCNEFSEQMVRDEEGYILYDGDIRRDSVAAMQQLGETYDQLDGYYPYPKPLATSDFFSQQYMCGYYFPFSMEANYNDVMYIMNMHSTLCHELAHLRGYIFEDEANFISYLACIQSEEPVVQYSGYLSVLNYLDNDYYKAVGKDWEAYISQPQILEQVHDDNIFLTEEEWDRIEDKAVLDTETVDEVSDAFTETTLKINGVSDGMISYSRVVKLLLQYYEAQGLF